MNFKEIHIGILISQLVTEREIEMSRICKFMKCTENEIERTYNASSIDADQLLRWSKLLEYDFFRIYSQHLILYAPLPTNFDKKKITKLPQFRKNIYTKEIINFILEQINDKKMTLKDVEEKYRIPKTTLYKWIAKFRI